MPRGFLGAAGSLEEVELVMVFAEPGDPHEGERHEGMTTAYDYATFGFSTGKDLFHRNVREILSLCWPEMSFEQQMRKVWLTESVLCSARKEGGSVSVRALSRLWPTILACPTRKIPDSFGGGFRP